jgi:hypothetical protein
MKKNLNLVLLGISLSFFSISLILIPKNVSATEDGKQWIEVKCDDLNGTVDCNDCISGKKSCNDNTCTACYGVS